MALLTTYIELTLGEFCGIVDSFLYQVTSLLILKISQDKMTYCPKFLTTRVGPKT